MSSVTAIRNILIVVGAKAASSYLAIPFWAMLAWARSAMGTAVIVWLGIGVVPAIAGAIVGWSLEAGSSRWWGVGLGALFPVESMIRYGWGSSNRTSLVETLGEAVICGLLAFGGFMAGEHVRRRNEVRKESPHVVA
jgi:hypothetical protein